jgi:hypothetical protein
MTWRSRNAGTALTLLGAITLAGCIQAVGRPGPSGVAASGGLESAASSIEPAPTGPTPVPSFVRPTPTPAPTFLVYVVKRGDNLNTIAHRYATTSRSIAYWNRGTYPSLDPEKSTYRPDLLKIGWSLVLIPHVVVDEQDLPQSSARPSDTSDPSEDEPSAS